MSILQSVTDAVVSGQVDRVNELTRQALDQGVAPGKIINEGLIKGMDIIGERFKNDEIFVPEMLISAKAMQGSLNMLKPLVAEGEVKSSGKVVIGTVKGDLHDIGKNLVAMMLEGAGFEIIDVGVDVGTDKFIENIKDHKPDILAMSALLTTTMPVMDKTIKTLEENGLRQSVKVIIGGAPVSAAFATEIKADGYAPDASVAVDLARDLVG
ncbi:MAG TPA: corrinoid protein [Clostridia bacterium]|nr:corrinoid protein [Clostridia bacterium]